MIATIPIIISANYLKEVAVKMGKQLEYQCSQRSVARAYEFDGSISCYVAVQSPSNTVNYYAICFVKDVGKTNYKSLKCLGLTLR